MGTLPLLPVGHSFLGTPASSLGCLLSLAFQKWVPCSQNTGLWGHLPRPPARLFPRAQCGDGKQSPLLRVPGRVPSPHSHACSRVGASLARLMATIAPPQLKARCEELKLDWSTLSLESLLKEKQALKSQISEKQRHCLELQVGRARALGFRGLQGCAQCPRHTCRGHPPEDRVLVLGVTVTSPRASPSSVR